MSMMLFSRRATNKTQQTWV